MIKFNKPVLIIIIEKTFNNDNGRNACMATLFVVTNIFWITFIKVHFPDSSDLNVERFLKVSC